MALLKVLSSLKSAIEVPVLFFRLVMCASKRGKDVLAHVELIGFLWFS